MYNPNQNQDKEEFSIVKLTFKDIELQNNQIKQLNPCCLLRINGSVDEALQLG